MHALPSARPWGGAWGSWRACVLGPRWGWGQVSAASGGSFQNLLWLPQIIPRSSCTCSFNKLIAIFPRPCAGPRGHEDRQRGPWETLTLKVRASRGRVLVVVGKVTSLASIFQPRASPPASCISPAATAVPRPPSPVPIWAGGSELKDVSGNEERSGCWSVWKSSRGTPAEALACH